MRDNPWGFFHDTIDLANEPKSTLRNIIHASDTVEDGEEVNLWFTKKNYFPTDGWRKFMYKV